MRAAVISAGALGAVLAAVYFAPGARPAATPPPLRLVIPIERISLGEAMRELAPPESAGFARYVPEWWQTGGVNCERTYDPPIIWKVAIEERRGVEMVFEHWPGDWVRISGPAGQMGFFPRQEACDAVVRRMRAR